MASDLKNKMAIHNVASGLDNTGGSNMTASLCNTNNSCDEGDDPEEEINIIPSLHHESTYDKLYACYYCHKTYPSKLSRHLGEVHANEDEVDQVLKLKKGMAQRKAAWAAIE